MMYCIAVSSKEFEVSRWVALEGATTIEEAQNFIWGAMEMVDPPEGLRSVLIGVKDKFGLISVVSYRDQFGPWHKVEPVEILTQQRGVLCHK